MQKEQKTAIVWFRNDLRVTDNFSLSRAREENGRVVGIYCLDPRHFAPTPYGFPKTNKFRARFLLESLEELKEQLSRINISLVVVHDSPENVIPEWVERLEASVIYCQREWTQEEVEIYVKLRTALPASVRFEETYDQFLYHPGDCPFAFDDIPKVFTEFRKKCEKQAHVRPMASAPKIQETTNRLSNVPEIPTLSDLGFKDFETDRRTAFPFKGGEVQAGKRLNQYFFETKKLGFYKKTRNGLLGTGYSSKFSPWLALGCISPRQIYWAVKEFEKKHYKNQSTYWLIFELIWRDFFKYISLKHGNQIFHLGGILNKAYPWDSSLLSLEKWINGETAEPFVNANMMELKLTGWMSNRGRQNVASYLARDMKVDWRLGAAYFESMLIDYDVHSNYGNWMYVAGVGNDPRDRKFNVRLQADRYDPQGKFQNLWLQKTLF